MRLIQLLTVIAATFVVTATITAPTAAAQTPQATAASSATAPDDSSGTDDPTASAASDDSSASDASASDATDDSSASSAADSGESAATDPAADTSETDTSTAADPTAAAPADTSPTDTSSATDTSSGSDTGETSSSEPTGSGVWKLRGDLTAHDPALVKGGANSDWYVFATGEPTVGGGNIQIRSSTDGTNWKLAGTVWDTIPAWLTKAVPGLTYLWAPEVYHHDGTYYLYYAASTWGSNNSIIALATNTTLDPKDPDYKWVDQGQVVRSTPQSNFNAIDPGVVEDAKGTPWLAFGSYWTGIQMVQLEWPTGKRSADKTRTQLADRKSAPNAIEAAYIVPHDGWFYLFTSWGQCCEGVKSDYKIVVGRSRDVTGPYVDEGGKSLLNGGGTVLQSTSGNRAGPGGQSVSSEIIAFHYYDAKHNGATKLALQRITWSAAGWPELTSDKS